MFKKTLVLIRSDKKLILSALAYLVPALIVMYVVFNAWQPFGHTTTYSFGVADKGSTDSSNDFFLDASKSQLSPPYKSEQYSYREITSNEPVYLGIKPEVLANAKQLILGLEIDAKAPLLIAVFNPLTSSTDWKVFYDPEWQNYKPIAEIGDWFIYSNPTWLEKNCGIVDNFEQCFDYLSSVKLDRWISSNVPKFSSIDFRDATIKQSKYVNDDIEAKNAYVTEIDTSLRGSHDFYVYLGNGLDLEIWKEDLNAENGADVLSVEIYDTQDKMTFNDTIPDDTIRDKSKKRIEQVKNFQAPLDKGLYLLKLRVDSGNDDISIKKIKLNTDKIVAKGNINLMENVVLYTTTPNNAVIEFEYTNKDKGKVLSIVGESQKNIALKESDKPSKVSAFLYGDNAISVPINNVKISSNLNFAFKKQNFFHPFSYYITDEKPDFLIVKKSDGIVYYTLPADVGNITIKKSGKNTAKMIRAEMMVKK